MAAKSEYIVSMLVEDRPGVLFRVTGLIRRRGFNIDSISVGPVEQGKLARMTIVVNGDERIMEQVVKQLNKLIEVVKVVRLEHGEAVLRELALVKVHSADSKVRTDLMHYARIFRGRIVDVSPDSMTFEVTGDPEKIDAFINLVKGYGIKEVARTGLTALPRGVKTAKQGG